jgi:hypothetical protein
VTRPFLAAAFSGAFTRRPRGLILAALVTLAAVLRFWGLSWGLPQRNDFHPDEHDFVIGHAQHVTLHDPDPKFLNYPSFLCYSTAILHGALKTFDPGRPDWKAYLDGRRIVALYGVLTVLAAFLLARRLGANDLGALLAAGWVAIMPQHVWDSHVAVTDVPMTFWTTMTLWSSLRLLHTARLRDCALAGVCLGLAVGSKYTAAMACLVPAALLLAARRPWRATAAGLAVTALASLAACFAVTPYSFLHFRTTLAAMAYENSHTYGHQIGFCIPAHGPQYRRYLYQLVAAWPFSFGVVLYPVCLAGVGWVAARRWRAAWPVLGFMALFFGITGSWTFTPLRYYLPVLVPAAVCGGVWLGHELSLPCRRRRLAALALAMLAVAYTVPFTAITAARYGRDTRVQASEWLAANLRPEQVLHVIGWNRYSATVPNPPYNVSFHREPTGLGGLHGVAPGDLVQITSLHYQRWVRHRDRHYLALYGRLRNPGHGFELVRRFEAFLPNRAFYEMLDPMFGGYFISPTIEIYRRLPPHP